MDTGIILMIIFAILTLLVSVVLQGMIVTAIDNKEYTRARELSIYNMIATILGILIVIGIFIGHMYFSARKNKEILGEKVKTAATVQVARQAISEKKAVQHSANQNSSCATPCPKIVGRMSITGEQDVNLDVSNFIPKTQPHISSPAHGSAESKLNSMNMGNVGNFGHVLPPLSQLH